MKISMISDFPPVTQQISALLESRRYEKWPCQQKKFCDHNHFTLEICLIKKYSQPGKVGKLDFHFDKGIDSRY